MQDLLLVLVIIVENTVIQAALDQVRSQLPEIFTYTLPTLTVQKMRNLPSPPKYAFDIKDLAARIFFLKILNHKQIITFCPLTLPFHQPHFSFLSASAYHLKINKLV